MNKVEEKYGSDCLIFYGHWSRKDQMKGCNPSPVVGLKKLISKRFKTVDVDEYKTSITCNSCHDRSGESVFYPGFFVWGEGGAVRCISTINRVGRSMPSQES